MPAAVAVVVGEDAAAVADAVAVLVAAVVRHRSAGPAAAAEIGRAAVGIGRRLGRRKGLPLAVVGRRR